MHKSLKDCWIILDGKVYDVTSYIYEHPGGSLNLIKCSGDGKDHIDDFEAEEHSKAAINKLKRFYILIQRGCSKRQEFLMLCLELQKILTRW